MTRREIQRRATLRAAQEARERHALIENKRIAKLESALVRAYIAGIERWLAEAAAYEAHQRGGPRPT